MSKWQKFTPQPWRNKKSKALFTPIKPRERKPMTWRLDPASPAAHALTALREKLWIDKLNAEPAAQEENSDTEIGC